MQDQQPKPPSADASGPMPAAAQGRLAARIDDLLPQTQCGKCGYGGCLPYARAIAAGEAAINRCPPGGERTIARLAELLGCKPLALDPECGPALPPRLARIDEAVCIGCTKCIQACPVDAIVGASRQMHTVIEALCTGCELCLPPCPVDCIDLLPRPEPDSGAEAAAHAARARFRARGARLARLAEERAQRRRARQAEIQKAARGEPADKQALIRAAIERTRRRRARLRAGLDGGSNGGD